MCSPTSVRSSTIVTRSSSAIEKEGLFPAVYLSTMRAQKKDKVDGLSYLEQQFSALDLPVPKLQRRFDEACKEAESLVFDLLSENNND